MPRAIWSGAITFGLVNAPVRLYSAISEHTLHFNFVHEKDGSRIGYQKVCKDEDRPVNDEEVVKAYEYKKGKYVYLTDEDFAAAESEGYHTIDIRDFVPLGEIDPIYFGRTYYLGPEEGAEKVYALLVKAMEKSGLAAIAKYTMRDRQYLGCLRVSDGVIILENMYFSDEVRDPSEIAPRQVDVAKRELEMAMALIDSLTSKFDPSKYEDTYRKALLDVIEKKRKGKKVHVPEHEEVEATTDLMDVLRRSLESAKQAPGNGHKRRAANEDRERAAPANEGLGELSRGELYERAKQAGIEGRSSMTKQQLVRALRGAA